MSDYLFPELDVEALQNIKTNGATPASIGSGPEGETCRGCQPNIRQRSKCSKSLHAAKGGEAPPAPNAGRCL